MYCVNKQVSEEQLTDSNKALKHGVVYAVWMLNTNNTIAEGAWELIFKNHIRNTEREEILTRNSSLIKYLALVTLGSSPGSGVAN